MGRADRQQRMLFAILEQLQSRDQLKNFPKIYLSVQDKVYTDLNVEQIAALTLFAMDLDLDTDLHRHTLEGEYVNNTPYSGASYYAVSYTHLTARGAGAPLQVYWGKGTSPGTPSHKTHKGNKPAH